MRSAKRKISQIDNLKIIAVTGSFGKTTVKEILYLILNRSYKVFASQGNVQDAEGIANTIRNNINFLADVLIVEVQPNERVIRSVSTMIKPDIAVITTVSDKDIARHEALENRLQDLYALVEESKDDACIILNADDPLCLRIASKSKKKERMYSTKGESDVYTTDIKSRDDRLEFNVHSSGDVQRFEVRMLGEHNVSNVLAAITCALELGMSLSEIADAIKLGSKRKQIGRLSVSRSRFGYRLIDDSKHSNPSGFAAALEFLKDLDASRKILVTIGITGPGDKKGSYKALAGKIKKICDVLITTDKLLRDAMKNESRNFKIIFDTGVDKQIEFLRNKVNRNDIVLFEGPNARLMEEVG